MDWNWPHLGYGIFLTMVYTIVGLICLGISYYLIHKMTVFSLHVEIIDKQNIALSDRQKEGVEMALTKPVGVITGGPGTGKTALSELIHERSGLRGQLVSCMPGQLEPDQHRTAIFGERRRGM